MIQIIDCINTDVPRGTVLPRDSNCYILQGAISMIIYTLYVKVHRKTGFRYLGQTKRDPYVYCGSGTDWLAHLKEHGNDIQTIILLQTQSKEERNYWGIHYSNLWNVISSVDNFGNRIWANRIPESGAGCAGAPKSVEHKQKLANANKGKKKTPEHIAKMLKSKVYITKAVIVNGASFKSVNDAASHFGVKHSTISNRLAGRKKPSVRFWEVRYADN